MDYQKQMKEKLISNLILSWCIEKQEEGKILFDRYNSTSYSFLFSDSFLKSFHSKVPNNKKFSLFYEILFENGEISISLISNASLLKENEVIASFANKAPIAFIDNENCILKTWNILGDGFALESLPKTLDLFLVHEANQIEKNIQDSFKEEFYSLEEEKYFIEGAMREIYTNRFERNAKARKKCIEANGAYCHICGFDFGEVYGEEFIDKIEVHHIVPLSEIRENYVLDPIKDLIPVCSNCHMILHSKKDGVYTPQEVREMLKKKR